MTTGSTMTDLKRRVARAADNAWLDAIQECEREKRPKYPRDIIKEHIIPAVLKAHAEWLDRNELEIRAKPPFNFTVNLLEETKPAAQQEDQHHD